MNQELRPAAHDRIASYSSPELRTIFGITLVAVLGVASIAPALPRLASELGISAQQAGLLVTVFTMPGIVLTPVLGVLADRYGRRRVVVPALLLFAIAGTACTFARSLELLLALRFLQGVGASPLGSLNVTLISDLFTGRQRTAAMGYNASVLSVGTATYPAVGGALAMLAWFYPFALAAFALLVAGMVMQRVEPRRKPQIESLAAYLGEVWRDIQRREVIAIFITSTGIFILLYGAYLTFFPFLMAERFTASPLDIGVLMSTLSMFTAFTSSQLGRLARRFAEKQIAIFGFAAFALGLALIPFAPAPMAMVVPAALLGFAFASTIPVLQTILAGLAPDERRAAFMSLNGMVLRLGQTLGPVVMAAIYAILGIDAVFFIGAALALGLGFLTAGALRG